MSNDPVKALVINLDHSPERMKKIAKNLDDVGVPYVRIAAVDGATEPDEMLYRHYNSEKNARLHYRPLKRGEIACYLSHRKACEYIIEHQLDCALVLEDDALVLEGVIEFINKLAPVHQYWDMVKIYHSPNQKAGIVSVAVTAEHELTLLHKVPSGAVAQLISFQGAKKFLAMSNDFGRPVDLDLRNWWEHDLRIFNVSKTLVKHGGFTSDIDAISGNRKVRDYPRLKRVILKLEFAIKCKLNPVKKNHFNKLVEYLK